MEHTCLNCGMPTTENFCARCGQKTTTHRITFTGLLHDLPHSFLHIDKGFFHTIKELALRPGKSIKEYISGKRIHHFSPFAYLVILCGVSSVVAHIFFEGATDDHIKQALYPDLVTFFRKYPALAYCTLIPFISFWSWLFNRRQGYNYWEYVVLNTYLVAQFSIILVLYRLFSIVTDLEFKRMAPLLVIFFTYFGFAYWQFFGRVNTVSGFINRVVLFLLIFLTVITGLTITGFLIPWWPH